jgi:hypothetical protein
MSVPTTPFQPFYHSRQQGGWFQVLRRTAPGVDALVLDFLPTFKLADQLASAYNIAG